MAKVSEIYGGTTLGEGRGVYEEGRLGEGERRLGWVSEIDGGILGGCVREVVCFCIRERLSVRERAGRERGCVSV